MFFSKKEPFPGAVVGTIYSRGSLRAALALAEGEVDFLEVRVDEFSQIAELEELEKNLSALETKAPLIVTVRRADEGGAGSLTLERRRELFERFLPQAALADVELRSATDLAEICTTARAKGQGVIFSYHDFHLTPPLERMRELAGEAARLGATVFKLAATAHTPADVAVLMEFLASPLPANLKLAVMGMGAEGKASRLQLGRAGSVLNYGYLDEPQVSGQWPAIELKQKLSAPLV